MSRWHPFYRSYTKEEKRKMISKVIKISLMECFRNHIYQARNVLYRQIVGGGIGARVTGVVARILMDVWADLLNSILENNDVIIYLLAKYVDDVNIATSPIPKGFSWVKENKDGWKLIWTE